MVHFNLLAPRFAKRLDGWRWKPCAHAPAAHGSGFAILDNHRLHFRAPVGDGAFADGGSADAGVMTPAADACTLRPPRAGETTVEFEVHVVYHAAYRVPALFFRAAYLDGRPVRRAALLEFLADGDGGNNDDAAAYASDDHFISDEEHPVLGSPFYVLHPCKTAARMGELLRWRGGAGGGAGGSAGGSAGGNGGGADSRYLLAWFTLVAPVLRIPFPPTLFSRAASMMAHTQQCSGVGGGGHAATSAVAALDAAPVKILQNTFFRSSALHCTATAPADPHSC